MGDELWVPFQSNHSGIDKAQDLQLLGQVVQGGIFSVMIFSLLQWAWGCALLVWLAVSGAGDKVVWSAAARAQWGERLQPQHSLKDLCHGCSILPFVAGLIVCCNILSSLMRGEWSLSVLPVLVSLDSPGASSEEWECSMHQWLTRKVSDLACFNYYIGAGALEVSVHLCLQDVGDLQMDGILISLSRAGAAWSLPSVHQHLPGGFGWLSSLLVKRNSHKSLQSQWCWTSTWYIKVIINDKGRREGCVGKLQRLIWNVIILCLWMTWLLLEVQLGCIVQEGNN